MTSLYTYHSNESIIALDECGSLLYFLLDLNHIFLHKKCNRTTCGPDFDIDELILSAFANDSSEN